MEIDGSNLTKVLSSGDELVRYLCRMEVSVRIYTLD